MKPHAIVFALLLGALSSLPTMAGDGQVWRYNKTDPAPAFPLSGRAESVWASGTCWSECGSTTTWNLATCVDRDAQGRCLKHADAGDRACQRACRTRGGPFLSIDTLFPIGF